MMTYVQAKEIKRHLEKILEDARQRMEAFHNEAEFTLEFKAAQQAYANAHSALRDFNTYFVKAFREEYRAERDERRRRLMRAANPSPDIKPK